MKTKKVLSINCSEQHPVYGDDGLLVAFAFFESEISSTIACDDVVALGGMRPLHKEAMAFFSCARQVIAIGDCYAVGRIHSCNRTAFAAASQI